MTTPAFYYGTGRRKTAIARVRLLPGEGEIVVNGRTLEEHFGNAVNEAGRADAVPRDRHRGPLQRDDQGRGRRRDRPGRRDPPRHRPGAAPGRRRRQPPAAPPGRPPDPRSADEGAQEVRAEARPQGARSTPSADAAPSGGRCARCAPRSQAATCIRDRSTRGGDRMAPRGAGRSLVRRARPDHRGGPVAGRGRRCSSGRPSSRREFRADRRPRRSAAAGPDAGDAVPEAQPADARDVRGRDDPARRPRRST